MGNSNKIYHFRNAILRNRFALRRISFKRSFTLSLLLASDVFLLDQVSKWLLLRIIPSPSSPPIELTSFFNLALVWNHGISFGMFAAHRHPFPLIALSLVIVVILLKWLYKNSSRWIAVALGCIIGGAVGNVVDRLRFGAVVDFFDAHIGPYHWPAFNIADSAIFIGVVLLCASSIMNPMSKSCESRK